MLNIYDKILGCWLGKCIGGNIGQAYEGMKQRMDIFVSREFIEKALPNDDLDLQILWLDVIKKKKLEFNGEDLADAFSLNCPYAPGEYAYFKKNYRKNIMPPLSGNFNNEFFHEGMGSPIRSEIWACLFFDDVDFAVSCAKIDSSLDHYEYGESYYGEVFITALECFCFYGGSPRELVDKALRFVPERHELYKTIKDVENLCESESDMSVIQKSIIRRHGHSESCMAKQNIAFLIAAFLLFGNDFERGVTEAVKCGFDSDCTGATLGSILGILNGGEVLKKLLGIDDADYKLGVKASRTEGKVSNLAKEVFDLHNEFSSGKKKIKAGYPVEQKGNPCISFGEEKSITLKIASDTIANSDGIEIRTEYPATICRMIKDESRLKNGEFLADIKLNDVGFANEGIKGEVFCKGVRIGRFGLSVRRQWKVYGPYWKNEVTIPQLNVGEKYGKYITGTGREERTDNIRRFHLSCIPDKDAVTDISLLKNEPFEIAETETDIIKIDECVGFEGNAIYYFQTVFCSDEEMLADAQFGKNVPIKIWFNGELISEKSGNERFYYETLHKFGLQIKKGENVLTFEVENNIEKGMFSYEFLTNGPCSDHYMFKIKNLKKD